MRKLLLIITLLFGGLLPPGYAGGFESEVIDLGGILADSQEERLETIALRIEWQSNIAVQVITSFYFAIDLGVEIYYTYGGTHTHDSRLVILLKTNSGSTTYDQDFVESLSLARSANLNTDDRVPDWLLTSVETAIEAKFAKYNQHDNPQLTAYRSLHYGLELLRATLHTPVDDGIYSGLISKTLWLTLSDAPDAYNAQYDYTPQVAGFINGLYQMLEVTAELPDMLLSGSGVMARVLWDYKTDYAYQVALHQLMDEAFQTLQDPVVQQMLAEKSHELFTQVADKGYDIFLMQTKEDKYWRGVIIFELLGVFEVVGGVKSLVKGASGVRALISKIKLRAKLPEGQVVTAGPSLDDLSRMVRGKGDEVAKVTAKGIEKSIDELAELVPANYRTAFKSDLADEAFRLRVAEEPVLVDAWKVLNDAEVDKILRSDPDKLTKVNRYLDNSPIKKDAFIDDLKNTSDPGKFVDRTSWKNDLIQRYGDDINQFKTQGLARSDVPEPIVSKSMFKF